MEKTHSGMNVGELREYLSQFDNGDPVFCIYVKYPHADDGYDGRVEAGYAPLLKSDVSRYTRGVEIGNDYFAESHSRDGGSGFSRRLT